MLGIIHMIDSILYNPNLQTVIHRSDLRKYIYYELSNFYFLRASRFSNFYFRHIIIIEH